MALYTQTNILSIEQEKNPCIRVRGSGAVRELLNVQWSRRVLLRARLVPLFLPRLPAKGELPNILKHNCSRGTETNITHIGAHTLKHTRTGTHNPAKIHNI